MVVFIQSKIPIKLDNDLKIYHYPLLKYINLYFLYIDSKILINTLLNIH